MLPEADTIRLRHMLDSAETATEFARGRTRADLDQDPMLRLAIVRAIEIIGEAAAKIGAETQAVCSTLPWPNIISMRNRLIHAYFDIDLDRVWETITDDLPLLIEELRAIINSD